LRAALSFFANRSNLIAMNREQALAEHRPVPLLEPLPLAGEPCLALREGALLVEREGVLVVADLHLEKGSAYARRFALLPPYDTRETLSRLAALVAATRPRAVACLGDSFHDGQAAMRLDAADRAEIARLTRSVGDWIWIEGNHDPAPPAWLGGRAAPELQVGALTLRHIPTEGPAPGELAGHLHPVARVRARGRAIRRRCFASDGQRAILPAFGAYAGGLNVRDAAFRRCFGAVPDAWMLGRDRVWPIGASAALPD